MPMVSIPTPLRRFTGGAAAVQVTGSTVADLLDDLERRFPGVKSRIVEENGELKHFVNIFLNDEDIRNGEGMQTAVDASDEVAIVPAIAGGALTRERGRW